MNKQSGAESDTTTTNQKQVNSTTTTTSNDNNNNDLTYKSSTLGQQQQQKTSSPIVNRELNETNYSTTTNTNSSCASSISAHSANESINNNNNNSYVDCQTSTGNAKFINTISSQLSPLLDTVSNATSDVFNSFVESKSLFSSATSGSSSSGSDEKNVTKTNDRDSNGSKVLSSNVSKASFTSAPPQQTQTHLQQQLPSPQSTPVLDPQKKFIDPALVQNMSSKKKNRTKKPWYSVSAKLFIFHITRRDVVLFQI